MMAIHRAANFLITDDLINIVSKKIESAVSHL